VLVGLAVVADEPRRRRRVGAEDRAADQVAHPSPGGGADRVAVPGQLVVRGRTEQEHLLGPGHRRIQGVRSDQVTRHGTWVVWALGGPGEDTQRRAGLAEQPDQLPAGPAPPSDHQDHGSPPRGV